MSLLDDSRRVDAACRFIASGRGLARQLTAALRAHHLSEAEFRLLWLLREKSALSDEASIEQSALVDALRISRAQVSAIVERLRSQRVILSAIDGNDRRRQLWQLTPSGRADFESIVVSVGLVSRGWVFLDGVFPELGDGRSRSQREDAA